MKISSSFSQIKSLASDAKNYIEAKLGEKKIQVSQHPSMSKAKMLASSLSSIAKMMASASKSGIQKLHNRHLSVGTQANQQPRHSGKTPPKRPPLPQQMSSPTSLKSSTPPPRPPLPSKITSTPLKSSAPPPKPPRSPQHLKSSGAPPKPPRSPQQLKSSAPPPKPPRSPELNSLGTAASQAAASKTDQGVNLQNHLDKMA